MGLNRKSIFSCLATIIILPLMLSAKSVKIRLIDNDYNQPIFGFPIMMPNSVDIKHIGVTDIYGEIILDIPVDCISGVCRITTNRCKIGIIVDGILKKTVKHMPEVLIN